MVANSEKRGTVKEGYGDGEGVRVWFVGAALL